MWERRELKERAKQGLRQYYGMGLLVVIVTGLLGGAVSGGGVNFTVSRRYTTSIDKNEFFSRIPFYSELVFFFIILLLFIAAASILFSIFLSNVVEVGKCRYFSISTMNGEDAGFGELFGSFRHGRYLNTVKVQFQRKLYEFLWTLLLIIPGIIKQYEYYMVPYLIAEYPDMESREVFRLSRRMMDGNKLDTFILELSFMGWRLLGALACGIGIIFVCPYEEATYAELYLKLREERLGIPRPGGSGRAHRPDRDGAVYTQPGSPDSWSSGSSNGWSGHSSDGWSDGSSGGWSNGSSDGWDSGRYRDEWR